MPYRHNSYGTLLNVLQYSTMDDSRECILNAHISANVWGSSSELTLNSTTKPKLPSSFSFDSSRICLARSSTGMSVPLDVMASKMALCRNMYWTWKEDGRHTSASRFNLPHLQYDGSMGEWLLVGKVMKLHFTPSMSWCFTLHTRGGSHTVVCYKGAFGTTYLCLNHVVPVFPHCRDVGKWVDYVLLVSLLDLYIYCQQCPCSTYTSTVTEESHRRTNHW